MPIGCKPTQRDASTRGRVRLRPHPSPAPGMDANGLTLGTVLLVTSGLFVLATLFFGTKGGYYDTDNYDGNGTAH